MSTNENSKSDNIEIEEDEEKLTSKPSWKHLEKVSENEETPSKSDELRRTPYWDTKNVVGAQRHLDSDPSLVAGTAKSKRGLWSRFRIHYRRYWKLYSVLGVIGLGAALPIFFLVIFPAIAQRIVDNANLPIHSASITSPTPDSVVYSMTASLKVPAGLTVDLKPITLSLFTNQTGPNDPYLRLALPEYHLKGNAQLVISNQTATILDLSQFETFLGYAIYSDYFTLSAAGATAAYLGILKAPVKLNKKVKLAGLNSVSGFSFNSAAIVFPPESDGTNLKGSVNLPNPSIVSFELGNVTLNMIVGGVVIGQGRLYDVSLAPGNNTVPIRATVDIKTMLLNLPVILAAEATALTRGNVVISASGNSTMYNGVHIPYFEAVLNNLMLTGEMPLIQILINSLQEYLGTNGSLLGSFLGALNGTNGLTSLLGGLTNSTNSNSTSSATNLLTSLGL